MTLPNKKRIVSIRVKIPANTAIDSPVSIKLQLQNPIIESVCYIAEGSTIKESGFQVLVNGIQTIPAAESVSSVDMLNASNWIPLTVNRSEIEEAGIQVPGSPYNVEVRFYNLSASVDYYASINLVTSPKIDLPKMPIQDDKILESPEYDS